MNVNDIRKDFPMYQNNPNMHYLDSAATSLKPKCVIDAMEEYYYKYGVNIHRGVYALSYKATEEYNNARERIAKFINASFEEVVFCKNTSEGLNQICLMYSRLLNEGDEILTTELEHHSSILPWQQVAKEKKLKLKYIELNSDGRITTENVLKAISENTKVIAITYASNTMGYITDIESIVKLAHKNGIVVIVDAAQMIPHRRIDVKWLDCDFLAFSAHKMFGPTGIGIYYGKKEILDKLSPIYYGGDMNDYVDYYDMVPKKPPFCFEVGTPQIAEVVGFAKAIDYIESIGYDNISSLEKELTTYAISKLKDIEGVTIYNPNTDLGIINFNIDGVHPHDAATFFDNNNVDVRAGYHCAQLVSKWLGCNGTLRASIYVYNDKEDIDYLVKSIKETVSFFKQFD